jgi:hypothetical protein
MSAAATPPIRMIQAYFEKTRNGNEKGVQSAQLAQEVALKLHAFALEGRRMSSQNAATSSVKLCHDSSFRSKLTDVTKSSTWLLPFYRGLIARYPQDQENHFTPPLEKLVLLVKRASAQENENVMLWALEQSHVEYVKILLKLSFPLPLNSLQRAITKGGFDVIHFLVPTHLKPTFDETIEFVRLHPKARPTLLLLISNLSRLSQVELFKCLANDPLVSGVFNEIGLPLSPSELFDFLLSTDVRPFPTLVRSLSDIYKLVLLGEKITGCKLKEIEFLVQECQTIPTVEMAEESLANRLETNVHLFIATTLIAALPALDSFQLVRKAMLARKLSTVEFLMSVPKSRGFVISSCQALVNLTIETLIQSQFTVARLMIERLGSPLQQRLLVIAVHLGKSNMLQFFLEEGIIPQATTVTEVQALSLPNREVEKARVIAAAKKAATATAVAT